MTLRGIGLSSDSPSSFHGVLKPLVTIGIVLIIVLASEAISVQLSTLRLIGSRGNVISPPNIGIYWDSNATNVVTSIDWGNVEPGTMKSVTLFIRNEGNLAVTLFLNASGWKPAGMSEYMNLTWDYDATEIQPGEIILTTIILASASSPEFAGYIRAYDVKQFNFAILISAFE